MFGIGKGSNGKVVAVADIGSGSAAVGIFQTGASPRLLSFVRESLPLEKRPDDALAAGVVQMLSSAGEKALAEYTTQKGPRISSCYCIVGAPWTRSFAGEALAELKAETTITDDMIADLAKQALAGQKKIDAGNVFEANVVRVLLNGYPTDEPSGKRAQTVRIFTLMSDCDPRVRSGAKDALGKLFPDVPVVWRSSARAALMVTKQVSRAENCLIVEMTAEATDLIFMRKGIMAERTLVPQGIRQMALSLAKDKPVEETIALLDMYEKQQGEPDAIGALEQSIAKVEPDLAHLFGESLAKLSSSRKLPEELILIAPSQLSLWLSRFFSRIDFTQFTVTTRPFSVSALSAGELLPVTVAPVTFADPGLAIGCALVNMELGS